MYLNTQYCKHVQSEFKAPNSDREMFNNKPGSTETMLAKQFLDLIDYQKNLLTPEEMQCYYNEYSSKIIARVVEKRTLHETINQYRSTDCGSVFSAPYAGSIRNFPISNNLNRPDVLPKQINKHNRTYNNNNDNNNNSENEEVETNDSSNEEDLFIPSRGKNNYNMPVPGRSTTSQRKVEAQVHMNDTVASRTRNARRKVRNDEQIPDVVPTSMRNRSPIKGNRKVINGCGKKPEQALHLYGNPGVPKGASTPIVTAAASKKTRNVHVKNSVIKHDSKPKRKQATKKPIDPPSRNDELDSDDETLSVFG